MPKDVPETPLGDLGSTDNLPEHAIAEYQDTGFVRLRGVLKPDEVERFRSGAELYLKERRGDSYRQDEVFTQIVNVWRRDATMRELSLHARIGHFAEQLAGTPLRLWHDQMLVKEARNNAATEFHQDRPYWPHLPNRHSLSAWIALVDVPPERGCMTFLPGSHRMTNLRQQDLQDAGDLFRVEPSLRWFPRVTLPLRAGDCTFHNSYTAHMALPNRTARPRLAHVNIYMDAETTYAGTPHTVTDPLMLDADQPLDGDLFPRPWGKP